MTQPLADPELLAPFMARDPLTYTFMLADLDHPWVDGCRYYAAGDPTRPDAVLLDFRVRAMLVVMTAGDDQAARALLEQHHPTFPRRFRGLLPHGHYAPLVEGWDQQDPERMLRLGLQRGSFTPGPALDPRLSLVGLDRHDLIEVSGLFQHYPAAFFDDKLLATGYFRGIRTSAGELVSVAGVHIVSPARRVAILGNVVTHNDWRGLGLARICTSAVIQALPPEVEVTALNVAEGNAAGRRVYESLGFQTAFSFHETWWKRKRGRTPPSLPLGKKGPRTPD